MVVYSVCLPKQNLMAFCFRKHLYVSNPSLILNFINLVVLVLQSNASLRHSTATKAARSPQWRTHCKATKFFGIRMRRRQCAAHSGARTAEQRNSSALGCDEGNASPTAAFALQSNEILALQYVAHSGVRTAEQRNSLIHGYPVML